MTDRRSRYPSWLRLPHQHEFLLATLVAGIALMVLAEVLRLPRHTGASHAPASMVAPWDA